MSDPRHPIEWYNEFGDMTVDQMVERILPKLHGFSPKSPTAFNEDHFLLTMAIQGAAMQILGRAMSNKPLLSNEFKEQRNA